jgi:uncharacterized membrane protein YesL
VSNPAGARRQFGEGPLARVAALVYSLLVVELLLLVAVAPGLVAFLLLGTDTSNIPLAAVCALPFGPAFSAALYALYRRSADLADLRPAALFWRGYRVNFRGALQVWVPWLALVTVVAVNLANLSAAGVPRWWAILLVLVAVAATLWLANALVITSLFAFRATDVARLAAYFVVRNLVTTLANACLVVVAAGVTVLFSEAVLALLGSVFALVLLQGCRSMIRETQAEFTA